MKLPIFFLFSLLLSTICSACAWDDDTLSIEAKGLPTVVDAIVGRLDINPPEYYTLRLKLSQERIDRDANDYEAYDNIAVAQDKLGNYKAAAEILAKKRARLEQNNVKPTKDPLRDPWYRYHANLGTVYAHQWVGEKRGKDVTLLNKAIEEIERAIEINPKAHFNRERVQLELLKMFREISLSSKPVDGFDKRWEKWKSVVQSVGEKAATEALIGIMLMGNSADSRDFMAFLLSSVPKDDFYVMTLAIHRNEELKLMGKPVHILDIENIADEWLPRSNHILRAQYGALRENAKHYREDRDQYIRGKIVNGKHPDSDPNFWNYYISVPRVNVAALEPAKPLLNETQSILLVVLSIVTALTLLLFFAVRKFLRRRKEIDLDRD